MPIQFRCTNCSKLLKTPDDSAGKQARCPQCGTVVVIPTASTLGSTDNPLGPFGSGPVGPGPVGPGPVGPGPVGSGPGSSGPAGFGPPGSSSPSPNPFSDSFSNTGSSAFAGSDNPYASPATSAGYLGKPAEGLPWENDDKNLTTFWATAKLVLFTPTQAFTRMRRLGGLGSPLVFAVAGGLIGAVFSAIYNVLLQVGIFAVAGANAGGNGPDATSMMVMNIVINVVTAIAGGTVGVVIGAFVGAAINHVCLYMLGARTYPYETTFRVGCYVMGSAALLQVVPFCGGMVQGIASLVYLTIGFSEAHQISKGKAIAAVLLPAAVCLVLVIVIAAMVGGFAAFMAAQN